MLGVFAEFERDVMIDRVVDGMQKKASTGQWTLGIPPYGYTVDPATRHLRPVPQEAAVVQEIFGLYTTRRMGARAVANELTQRGYRHRSGRPWSAKTITDTLRNPAYIGTVAFRDVTAEHAHPPIIDRKTFTFAGTLLSERGDNPAKAACVASTYQLTGKVVCPKCGKQYVGTTATGRSRTYRYYTCHTRNRHGTTSCDAPRIDADTFDARVLAAMADFYQTRTNLITDAINAAHEIYRATRQAVEAELRAVNIHIAQKEIAVDRYFTDYENGKIDQSLLEHRIDKLRRELRDLRRHRDHLQLRLDNQPHHLTDPDPTAVSNHIGEIITHATAATRRALYEATIHQLRLDLDTASATPVFRADTPRRTLPSQRNPDDCAPAPAIQSGASLQ